MAPKTPLPPPCGTVPDADTLDQWLKDWNVAQPPRLTMALKEWDPSWVKGEYKALHGMKYLSRKVVGQEHERFVNFLWQNVCCGTLTN
jgi:hypothetical protein